ncbi:uroporphyrinogen decarboxylase [Pterulicium gracile]|uniref:Uroporphyrinogen decarboxylase n=1 Tax=Pterulicium gracile TaxID=1884261 RepID=A0A5C3QXN4_9AGAR|nr:uroporphyrinogen decarboxylase [Pterula gracilis]
MVANFPPLKNDLILRAARGEKTERVPVWVMRQAGRYLPEFREERKIHQFFEICRSPELACKVTLQPITRFSGLLDASIIFSDILVVPQAMGMEVIMNPGPHFPAPLETPDDISRLKDHVDVDKELGYVFDAITTTRHALKGEVPLIGFSGAPWTLFAYMIEGGSSKTLQKSKSWLFKYPEESKKLLLRIADIVVEYLVGQVKAGAQLLQVFDSNAGDLSPHDFAEFALPSLIQISSRLRSILASDCPPLILFPKGANTSLATVAEKAGYDVVGIDWCITPTVARSLVGSKIILQGNMDPSLLVGGREAIEKNVKRMCSEFGAGGSKGTVGWIGNLGHGITPQVDPEDLRFFLECMQKYST